MDWHNYIAWASEPKDVCSQLVTDLQPLINVLTAKPTPDTSFATYYTRLRGLLGLTHSDLIAITEYSGSINNNTRTSCSPNNKKKEKKDLMKSGARYWADMQMQSMQKNGLLGYFWKWNFPNSHNFTYEWSFKDMYDM